MMRLPLFVFQLGLPKASSEMRREVFYTLDLCLAAAWHTERGLAQSLRSETEQGV